jgi:FkbM family methyltransferase
MIDVRKRNDARRAAAQKFGAIRPFRLRELLFWQVLWPGLGLRLANHLEPGPPALEFLPGVALSLTRSDPGHLAIHYCGFLELTLSRRMAGAATKGGLLVDVGANHGYFTCLWAAARLDNQVIAFEPARAAYSALLDNLRSNDLDGRVDAHRMAVGRKALVAEFVESPGGQSGMSRFRSDHDDLTPSTTVEVTTLDAALFAATPDPRVDVLKIDAEGADAWVLEGAERLLRERRIRDVFFEQDLELQHRLKVTRDAPQAILNRCGYTSRRIGRFVWHASQQI